VVEYLRKLDPFVLIEVDNLLRQAGVGGVWGGHAA